MYIVPAYGLMGIQTVLNKQLWIAAVALSERDGHLQDDKRSTLENISELVRCSAKGECYPPNATVVMYTECDVLDLGETTLQNKRHRD